MIHGWGMNSGVWKTVRPALEEKYTMHWIDLPGYGENSDIVADSMENIVDLIVPNIPDNAHVVGWSLGGLIAQAIADNTHISPPSKLKSLTLVASSPKFSQSYDWVHAISLEILNNFSKNLKNDVDSTLKSFVALQFMGIKGSKALQKTLIDELLMNISYKTGKMRGGVLQNTNIRTPIDALNQTLNSGLEILKHADYRKSSHNIPQHWILADRDRLIPPTVRNDLKLLRADDQITLLENTGHAPFMTHPKEFLASLTTFVDNHS